MDGHTAADELPALYRVILDGVARLERTGERIEAARIRREATRHYSRSWDDACRKQLTSLVRRLERELAGAPQRVPAGVLSRGKIA